MDILFGLYRPPVWVYFVYAIVLIQISIAAVTLNLHRDQTHRGVDFHPALRHFFRLWLWLTTGIVTREWVAVHRKHHARCETEDDPHSPQVLGIRKVLLEGAELYQAEAAKPETIEKYGRGTPDDWLERHVYRRNNVGIAVMLIINLALFGVVGLTIWAAQMAAMPVFSAGVINGIGHWRGYRNFECDDAATNITPVAAFLGGEELHNNHHAFPSSAKFSVRKWEFDIGWLYISACRALGLARVRRTVPQPTIDEFNDRVDLETVRAVIVNRMHVLRDYSRMVTVPVLRAEIRSATSERAARMWRRARRALTRRPELLDEQQRERLQQILADNATMRTVHEYRERLHKLWSGATVSNDRLLNQLRDWCNQAEATGIRALEEFSRRLRGYTLAGGTA